MHFILLSLACSVLVSVLLKLAPRRGLDVAQMVTWNYLAAALLCAWLLQPPPAALRQPGTFHIIEGAGGGVVSGAFKLLGAVLSPIMKLLTPTERHLPLL